MSITAGAIAGGVIASTCQTPGGVIGGVVTGALMGNYLPTIANQTLISAGKVLSTWKRFAIAGLGLVSGVPLYNYLQSLNSKCYCLIFPDALYCKFFGNAQSATQMDKSLCQFLNKLPDVSNIFLLIGALSALAIVGKGYLIWTGRDVRESRRIEVRVTQEVMHLMPQVLEVAQTNAHRRMKREESQNSLKIYVCASVVAALCARFLANSFDGTSPYANSAALASGVTVLLYGAKNIYREDPGYTPFSGEGRSLREGQT